MNLTVKDLAVFTNGNPNKNPIVFVHGFPLDHFMWDKQVEFLSNDFYCVRYDI